MKLSDIIQEEGTDVKGPVELKDVKEYFPTTYKKAIATLARKNRLTFGGEPLYQNDEDGRALDQAVEAAKSEIAENKYQLTVEIDGTIADKDYGDTYTVEAPVVEPELEYVGYDERGENLVLGFQGYLNEDDFNADWDKEFEKTSGEEFDYDNDEHREIYNHAWEQFKKQMVIAVIVVVNDQFHVQDLDMREGTFFKSGLAKAYRAIDIFSH